MRRVIVILCVMLALSSLSSCQDKSGKVSLDYLSLSEENVIEEPIEHAVQPAKKSSEESGNSITDFEKQEIEKQQEVSLIQEDIVGYQGEMVEESSIIVETDIIDNITQEDRFSAIIAEAAQKAELATNKTIGIGINGVDFTATLEDNTASEALIQLLQEGALTIQMSDYGGFEKVGSLGQSLPSSNQQMTTKIGDIVLYQGNQIVLFYGANTWGYTKLGTIDSTEGLIEALGSGDSTVEFSIYP